MIALGDATKRALSAVGITKDRIQTVTGKADCGCCKRQDALNDFGFRWQMQLRVPYLNALYYFEIATHWARNSRFGYAYWHFREGLSFLLHGHSRH